MMTRFPFALRSLKRRKTFERKRIKCSLSTNNPIWIQCTQTMRLNDCVFFLSPYLGTAPSPSACVLLQIKKDLLVFNLFPLPTDTDVMTTLMMIASRCHRLATFVCLPWLTQKRLNCEHLSFIRLWRLFQLFFLFVSSLSLSYLR